MQSRLAERLQANHSGGNTGHWLGVQVEGHQFLLPLTQSGEIYPWAEPLPVAYTEAWFLGVANLRGALCGVVSLPQFLQLPSAQVSERTKTDQDRRLVALHPAFELNVVLAVDQLLGLKNADQFTIAQDSNQLVDSHGAYWRPLDLAQIIQTDSFLSIAAP